MVLFAGSALFAAWISLVPFGFAWPTENSVRNAIAGALEWHMVSRSNFLANILLFVPVGFFGAAAILAPRRSGLGLVSRSILLVVVSIGVSAAIEAAQVFLPSRTAALSDVVAQTLGSSLGIAAWLSVRGELERLFALTGAGGRYAWVERVLAVYTLGRAIALLLPLDVTVSAGLLWEKYREGRIRLLPFAEWDLAGDLQNAVTAAVLSAPIGALALVGGTRAGQRRGIPAALVISLFIVFCLECGQVLVLSRVAGATDIVVSWVGAAAGVCVAAALTSARAPSAARGATWWISVWAVALSAFACILYGWAPFDFEVNVSQVRQRLPGLIQLPFYNYYMGPELQSLTTFAIKFTMAVPIGLFGHLALAPVSGMDFMRLRLAALSLAVAVFFFLIEAGQLFLPSRYPDGTDVLIGMLGFAAGTAAAVAFPRAHA